MKNCSAKYNLIIPKGPRRESGAGFTMVELIVTIAILSFGILGVYGAFSPLIAQNYTTASQFKAIYLAQEGFEIIKNMRDNNIIKNRDWNFGLQDCGGGCQADYKTATMAETSFNELKAYDENNFLKINADGFYGYDAGTNTIFKRRITIIQLENPDILRIEVKIFWDYNNKPFDFETIGYLYNL